VLDPGATVELELKLQAGVGRPGPADRHLILSALLDPEEAATLRDLRARSARASLDLLNPGHARVCQTRLTPKLDATVYRTSCSCPSTDSSRAPLRPPDCRAVGVPSEPALLPSVPCGGEPSERRRSVAQVVAELQGSAPASAGVVVAVEAETAVALRPQSTPGHLTTAASPTDVCGGKAEVSEDSASSSVVQSSRWRVLLDCMFDEFSPWLKWKMYDILWALGLILLGRRLKCIRRAQKLLDL